MKNMQCCFQRKGATAILAALAFFLLISCKQGAQALKDYDISVLYGYTFHGNITASSGNTLKPSFILYNDERAEWNMSINGMNNNQFYYYAVKNSKAKYTLYWFGASDYDAAKAKDQSKAAMKVLLGIDSLDQIKILLIGDGLTGIEEMKGAPVPMTKQTDIPRKTTPPPINFDSDIQDITIDVPFSASEADWGGVASYAGTFDYLVGKEGELKRGHGTCGKDAAGNEIIPKIRITPDSAGSHTVKVNKYRAVTQSSMNIESFDVPGVKVFKYGAVYYLKYGPDSVEAVMENGKEITLNNVTVHGKLENGKLTLRVSFMPGKMQIPVTEIFKSK